MPFSPIAGAVAVGGTVEAMARALAPGGAGQSPNVAFAGAAGGRNWDRGARTPQPLPLGAPDVDAALGGGLRCGALHEAAGAPGDEGALSAFALGLAARAAIRLRRPVLLVRQDMAEWEAGRLHGPGLAALGLPPEALLLVRVRKPQDVLFVMEEGLKCAGLSVVLGEFLSPVPEVLTATRRLALAVRGSDRLGLMLRHKADPSPSAALTRWRISTLPSPALDGFGGLGAPRFTARLTRNRFGPVGAWPLLFRDGLFQPAPDGEDNTHEHDRAGPALSQSRAALSRHGSRRPADVA
ncbi:ImuA family protein [Xanthobacter agilis]|uniref:ImuA family protein n=1 Tax=Xanthobacter agilis TaxID=47492 RepID=UPI00372BA727